MALKKEIVKKNGIITTYHKIDNLALVVNEEGCSLFIDVVSYLNEEYRNKNAHVESNLYTIPIESDDTNVRGIRQFGYDMLKTLPEWEDAEDC